MNYHTEGHRLTGMRVPNLPLSSGHNVFDALVPAQPVLLARPGVLDRAARAAAGAAAIAVRELPDFSDRVDWRDVRAALIRPDGYVAWASDVSGEGAGEAMTSPRPHAPVLS